MGAGCSSEGSEAVATTPSELPPRPVYTACDLVSSPDFEALHIGVIDTLFEQCQKFGESVCALNASYQGLVRSYRALVLNMRTMFE